MVVAIMEAEEELYAKTLSNYTYRQLQQLSKSLGLPSNFKKIYLMELLQASKFKTKSDVVEIIARVREERLNNSKLKKKQEVKINNKNIKINESTHRFPVLKQSSCFSPPIAATPKRPNKVNIDMDYSPEIRRKAILPLNLKRNLLQSMIPNKNTTLDNTATASDRVLRSNNSKNFKPNYALINNDVQETQLAGRTSIEPQFGVNANKQFPQFNITSKCHEIKNKNFVSDRSKSILKKTLLIGHSGGQKRNRELGRRQRRLSGISPLRPQDVVNRNLSIKPTVCLRNIDGSYTAIKALVRKSDGYTVKKTNFASHEMTTDDIVDTEDDYLADTVTIHTNKYLKVQYPPIEDIGLIMNIGKVDKNNNYKVNKLSSKQPAHTKKPRKEGRGKAKPFEYLPHVNDAYPIYNCNRESNQPLYVQAGTNKKNVENVPIALNHGFASPMLESLYNIKMNTTSKQPENAYTTSVDAISSISSVFPSAAEPTDDDLTMSLLESDNYLYPFDMDLRLFDLLHPVLLDSEQSTDFNSSSSQDTSPSIPEMVDDALEIISQDGDYMERMGINIRVNCVLCPWAGPRIILDSHTRKEHADVIHKQPKSEWNVTFTLESLVMSAGWLRRVVEQDSMLYMLSAKYEDPGYFVVTLSTLSVEVVDKSVTITLHNRATGAAHSWPGPVPAQPPSSPRDADAGADCFRIDLAKLGLLTSGDYVKLLNGELVGDLSDVHITVFVNVYQ